MQGTLLHVPWVFVSLGVNCRSENRISPTKEAHVKMITYQGHTLNHQNGDSIPFQSEVTANNSNFHVAEFPPD